MQSQVVCPRRISGINPALWCPVFFPDGSRWIHDELMEPRAKYGRRKRSTVGTHDRVSAVERSNADRDARDLATSVAAFYDITCTWARLRTLLAQSMSRLVYVDGVHAFFTTRSCVVFIDLPCIEQVCDDALRHLVYSLAKSVVVREEKRSLKVLIITW